MTVTTGQSLERLIDQQIELGRKNPHEFFDILQKQLGEELTHLAVPYIADLIAEMARQRLNNRRRQSIARISNTTLADPQVKLRSLWIPGGEGIVYKRIADMTADDFEARADYLERMMIGISRHAAWCRAVATELRDHNLVTANDLQQLPALPELDDLTD